MYKADYHVHTNYSLDSVTPMEEQIKRAISLGFNEMVITDHHEADPSSQEFHLETNISDYINQFNRLKEQYKNHINLKLGAEIGYEARGRDVLDEFINNNPFEFIICSMHSLNGQDFYSGNFFAGKTKKEAFREYFHAIKECIDNFDNFDVLGHVDFICRYGNYPNTDLDYMDYREVIDEILCQLIRNSKGIEVNTSGLRYGVGHMHPRFDIIKRYKDLGGEIITIGSDAHRPEDIGADYEKGRQLLKEAGFKYFTTYNNRKAKFRKL
ncbi:MAG: histidinol-phosphatase HisJ family protein [Epulopiscium sp.]|nr:histidinol-phosphatase HisJ family protein [Candidatus Epulonipiscium sp.]